MPCPTASRGAPHTTRRPLSQSRSKSAKKKPGSSAQRGPRKPDSPYFLGPVAGGIGVYRKPVGNRAEPTTCGIMPNKRLADALVAQLKRAESAVADLFLEATDDGIEALEAVLAACRDAVIKAGGGAGAGGAARPPRGPRQAAAPREGGARADGEGSERAAADRSPGAAARRRGRGRRRGAGRARPGGGSDAPATDA